MQKILARIKDNNIRKMVETCRIYNKESKDDFKLNCCRLYIEKNGVIHNLSEIKVAAIKKDGEGIYYWNNNNLFFKGLKGWNILFEHITEEREEMENLLKRLESGDIKIKRKIKS
jgi:phosphoenolpyruvate synthase/pyruvate phosphate dikinase